ncbi:MAG TPA: aminotransferase class V-fold PLP-dependent enzyme, partial [Myxococcaceae bacterium]|nr:aminotransferase class V-fold PLP-dependent enzyme [Myxococcaceae bacterium]
MHTSWEMLKARPYVPAQPTLGWEQLRAATRPLTEHPFSADAVSWTHRGRSALQLAARVLGLEGREVLVPAYHQGVEVDALLAAGAQPTFYTVGTRWTVDLEDLERRIGPRTRGLVLTHFGGFPGPASQMRALADRHGLVLIEDCAQALGSLDGEIPLGATGDAAVFSLPKTLPVPHGGALVFNGQHRYQLPPLRRPAAAPTVLGLGLRMLLRGEFRLPSQGGALRQLGR